MSKTKIKFGTDGWRAIIAKDYTVDNVARVTAATAEWIKQNYDKHTVVIGHDCRFAGELFAETAAKVFVAKGVRVMMARGFVSTPMVALGAVKMRASLGVVITASHNPPSYNGYKLKGHYGGPLTPDKVQEIEDMIPEEHGVDLDAIDMDEAQQHAKIEYIDLETLYVDHVKKNFDIDAIKNSGLNLAYDAMYGAGQNVLKRIFPDMTFLHCEDNPGFHGQAPEPIDRNLQEFSKMIRDSGEIDCGLATDGDADRIGLYNSKGEFVDSHHIILLLVHYMKKYKEMDGDVLDAASCTPRIGKMAEHYGLKHDTVKIGFKWIAGIMIQEDADVLVGGEESGGIAVKGHIPERDGIWMGMIIWEFMAKTGKSLDELVQEVYEIVGEFKFERNDLHLPEDQKQEVIANCKADKYSSFGDYKIEGVSTIDGFKYFLDNGGWVMIRPSGTEPVLRIYAEGKDMEEARDILKATKATVLN